MYLCPACLKHAKETQNLLKLTHTIQGFPVREIECKLWICSGGCDSNGMLSVLGLNDPLSFIVLITEPKSGIRVRKYVLRNCALEEV